MASQLSHARQLLASSLRPLRSPRYGSLRPRLGSKQLWRRPASTSSSPPTPSPLLSRLKILVLGSSAAASAFLMYYYATDTRASVHQWLVPPLIRTLYPDAEDAHHIGTVALKALYSLGMHPRERASPGAGDGLSVSVFGETLPNPIGISAGLDKDAEIPDALFALGASVVEVGGCTPLPQAGNPRPRVFRVVGLEGLVNRYGLNSRGADAVAAQLRARLRGFARAIGASERDVLDGRVVVAGGVVNPGSLQPGKLLAVQVAKNKATDEKDVEAVAADYAYCVRRLAPYADVLVVNVSSPNTPGLRDLQAAEPLTRILGAVVDEAGRTQRRVRPRVMVKVSPDEDDESQIEGVARAVWASGVDGVIVGNTTKRRAGLVPGRLELSAKEQQALAEEGGFSGPAMFDRTLDLVRRYRAVLDRQPLRSGPAGGGAGPAQKVIFATGGVTNGQQALKVLNAGASVALLYTGLVYGGSGTVTRIKREMVEGLRAEETRAVEEPRAEKLRG